MKKDDVKIIYSDDFDDEDDEEFEFSEEDDEEESKRPNKFFVFIRMVFFTIILLIALTVIYSRYIGTSGLFVKEYNINKQTLPSSFDGFKIVHFGDLHLGSTIDIGYVENLINTINKTNPDVVIFSGDLINDNYKITKEERDNLKTYLKNINTTYGKYYVSGEDDISNNYFKEVIEGADFKSLDDRYQIITSIKNESILLSGLNYNNDDDFIPRLFKTEIPSFKINVMHKPDQFKTIQDKKYDIVLSGHSHNGQIKIPIYGNLVNKKDAKTYFEEYYKIDDTDFYITSGIGSSPYNLRLLNRPSFNFYRLKKQ